MLNSIEPPTRNILKAVKLFIHLLRFKNDQRQFLNFKMMLWISIRTLIRFEHVKTKKSIQFFSLLQPLFYFINLFYQSSDSLWKQFQKTVTRNGFFLCKQQPTLWSLWPQSKNEGVTLISIPHYKLLDTRSVNLLCEDVLLECNSVFNLILG